MDKPRILIVDDYKDNRDLYSHFLSHEGFQVDSAAGGEEAVDKALQILPDLIIMDLSLPDIDGWEATRRLKAAKTTSHIPVVILTAYDLPPGPTSGCDGILIKPCRPDKLVSEILRILDGRTEVKGSATSRTAQDAGRSISPR